MQQTACMAACCCCQQLHSRQAVLVPAAWTPVDASAANVEGLTCSSHNGSEMLSLQLRGGNCSMQEFASLLMWVAAST